MGGIIVIFISKMINILAAALLVTLISVNTYSQGFTKITTGAFVNDGGASRSVNFVDYDNDGDLDLYVSNGKRFGQKSFMYQNNNGEFIRILNMGPVNDSLPFDGASWGDFDNDGNIDMCAVTWYDSISVLYKNDGGGNFTFLGSSPIVINRGFSETCSWGDYDNDGLIDIIVTNSRSTNSRNRLYKNMGGGNFVSVDSGAVFNDVGSKSRGVNWIDIDNDNDLDLYITHEGGANAFMYKNEGSGYFTKITGVTPVTSGGERWSSSWGDYDNDGDFDLFVTGTENQTNKLFRNDGNFTFSEITNDTIVNDPGYHACSGWGDYDNDGDLDMFVTQAYKTPNSPMNNKLYKNLLIETGTPSFEKITTGDLVNDPGYSYGFAWADWNADGHLDIFTARTYNENQNNSAFLNNGHSNHYLELKLQGGPTNRSAIGTKVRIKATINGQPRWQVREVTGQSGYCGQNLDLHFGVGDSYAVDSIRVEWLSGAVEHFTGVISSQILKIVEGQGIIGIQQIGNEVPQGFKLEQNFPNPFNPNTNIKFEIPKASHVKLAVYDISGREAASLVNNELAAGIYSVDFNASHLSSGVYFYTLSNGGFADTKKMILVK